MDKEKGKRLKRLLASRSLCRPSVLASLVWFCAWFLACQLTPAAAASELIRYSLSDYLPPYSDVSEYYISPDGSRVVCYTTLKINDKPELYSLPLRGGEAEKLNVILNHDTFIQLVLISPDSRHVVFRSTNDFSDTELYSVPLTGGTPVKLNQPPIWTDNRDYGRIAISPDSKFVVFTVAPGDLTPEIDRELYRVPINNGPVVKLNAPIASEWRVDKFIFGPDGDRLLYIVEHEYYEFWEYGIKRDLYSVPLSDDGTAIKLNASGKVEMAAFNGDGSRVLYLADQEGKGSDWLYSVAATGGTAVRLNGETDLDVLSFQISPDDSRVVYACRREDGTRNLYSVSLSGGTPVQLNDSEYDTDFVFAISPDSSRVIYGPKDDAGTIAALHSVPLTGGPTVPLGTAPSDRAETTLSFLLTPDSSRVISVVRTGEQTYQLTSTPLAGGPSMTLLTTSAPLSSLTITADGKHAVYSGAHETEGVNELFSLALDDGKVEKLNGPPAEGGTVAEDFAISPDGRVVLYRSDMERYDSIELFGVFDTSAEAGILRYFPAIIGHAKDQ